MSMALDMTTLFKAVDPDIRGAYMDAHGEVRLLFLSPPEQLMMPLHKALDWLQDAKDLAAMGLK